MRKRRIRRAERQLAAATSPAELGRLGEQLAKEHLGCAGYRCVARNLRTRYGEIDLLLRRRGLYVAVEVKTRRCDPAPESAVDDDAIGRLTGALSRLAPHLRPWPTALRIDVVAVRVERAGVVDVRHFPGEEFDP